MDKRKVIRRLKYQVTFSERSFLICLHVVMISWRLLSEEVCCLHNMYLLEKYFLILLESTFLAGTACRVVIVGWLCPG